MVAQQRSLNMRNELERCKRMKEFWEGDALHSAEHITVLEGRLNAKAIALQVSVERVEQLQKENDALRALLKGDR